MAWATWRSRWRTAATVAARSFASNTSKAPKASNALPTSTSPAASSARSHDASITKARKYSPAVGLVAGLFGSMIGVGGGVLMNPMILSMCNTIPQRVLTGTSLGAVVSTALASGSVFVCNERVDLGSAALIASAAMLTAPVGARLTSRLDCRQLRKILGYFLFGAAPLVPLKALLSSDEAQDGGSSDAADPASNDNRGFMRSIRAMFNESPLMVTQMMVIGGTAGLFSGLLGIGGGTIVTPLLAITTSLDHSVILGTSMTGMIAPSIVGMVQHYRMGNVDPRLLVGLVIGTGLGGFLGSKIVVSPDLPSGSLETLFCLGMLFLGKKTLASIPK